MFVQWPLWKLEPPCFLQLLLNDRVWKLPGYRTVELSLIYVALSLASHFYHYLVYSNFSFSAEIWCQKALFEFPKYVFTFHIPAFLHPKASRYGSKTRHQTKPGTLGAAELSVFSQGTAWNIRHSHVCVTSASFHSVCSLFHRETGNMCLSYRAPSLRVSPGWFHHCF